VYRTGDGPLTVLDDVDLVVPAGGYVSMTGRSGAGKSTLLAILGGLERPQHGSVRVGSEDLSGMDGDALAEYRRTTVGFVFQHFGLLDALTALENVELAGTLNRERAPHRRARSLELLDAVGIAARADHRPLQLSGGERQRVAIARALANRPRLLLADEPTGNLDEAAADGVLTLIESLADEMGCTLVVVTHNHAVAARAHQHLTVEGGQVRP
jgi:predicted ABC-type transport system involved in lysophospholipase L1 biosynthesis ATPase subunit